MAKRSGNSRRGLEEQSVRRAGRTLLDMLLLGVRACAGLAMVVGLVWGYTKTERYLSRGERFTLQPPGDGETPGLELHGVRYGSEHKVRNVFAADFGRSVFLCPINERRRALLAIDWVADATIQRIWPDRLVVRIREREPVAYVEVPGPGGSELAMLIDAEGVLLDPQRAQMALPVLSGIALSESERVRKDKVRRFLQLQAELGSHIADISEIDLSDIDNTRVVRSFDGRALTLALGADTFGARYKKFLDNIQHIRERLPNAVALDMRLKGRIMAVSEPSVKSPEKRGVKR